MDFGFDSKTTGTYIKVIQNAGASFNNAYLVLYLLDSGIYLFIGYWQGYELTVAAGHWSENKDRVKLDGKGKTLFIDVVPFNKDPRRHEREFSIVIDHASPALSTDTEHEGWSLLSWPGRFNYLGRYYFFDLQDDRLPKSFKDIEIWIRRFMDDHGFCITYKDLLDSSNNSNEQLLEVEIACPYCKSLIVKDYESNFEFVKSAEFARICSACEHLAFLCLYEWDATGYSVLDELYIGNSWKSEMSTLISAIDDEYPKDYVLDEADIDAADLLSSKIKCQDDHIYQIMDKVLPHCNHHIIRHDIYQGDTAHSYFLVFLQKRSD